jgi:hypothetical protein
LGDEVIDSFAQSVSSKYEEQQKKEQIVKLKEGMDYQDSEEF